MKMHVGWARRTALGLSAFLVIALTACGGEDPRDAGRPAGDPAPESPARETSSSSVSTLSFESDNLPLDASLDPAREGPPFRSDREAASAFEKAYRSVDLNRMQEIWWRMSARQRLAAYEAGKELSDNASMRDYQRMLPAEYLLDAENFYALEEAADREARGESPDPVAVPAVQREILEFERGTLRGVVVVEGTGEPVEAMELIASPGGVAALQTMLGTAEPLGAVTASDGTFEISGVPAGPVSLVGQKLPHYPGIADRATVVADEVVEVRIEVPPARSYRLELPVVVAGVVRDELTGEPVVGVHVSAGRYGGATSDERGRYLIGEADLGDIELETEHSDYHPATANLVAERRGRIDHDLSIRPITTGELLVAVVDRTTGKPIPNAEVTVAGRTLTTDASGALRIDEVEAGELLVTASNRRYRAASDRLLLERRATLEARLELDPITEGTVLGRVTDAVTRNPVAGARIQIGVRSVESDAQGRFELAEVPAGAATVTVRKAVYESTTETVEVLAADSVDVALTLEPVTVGVVEGVVVAADSRQPIPGAEVRIADRRVTAGPDGSFRFEAVGAGDVSVAASKAVFESGGAAVRVVAAESVSVELALEPITWGTIAGVVVDATSGRPVAGVTVSVPGSSIRTDTQGRFELQRVRAGRLLLSASRPVYEPAQQSLELAPAETLERRLTLEPITYGALAGRVVDADTGAPIASAEVSVGTRRLTTDRDGRFQAERIDAGPLTISAHKSGYRPGGTPVVLEPAGSADALVELEPIRVGSIEGIVRDARTGEPIAGARVAVGGREVETDSHGRFRLTDIDAGIIGVSARHADYADRAVSGKLAGADTLELEVRLDLRREDVTELESALASKGTIDLYGIHFDSGSDQFKPSSLGTLNAVLQVIKRDPDKVFLIAGHTDSDGTDGYNQDLSERRARTVIDWLTERGIEASRLRRVGYGESRPAAPNDTPSGKALNRRVELSYGR